MSEASLPPALFPFQVGLFFLFGSLLGSFCNVVILRMAQGRSVVFPPSQCPHCSHRLSPFDLIPIFGWVFLRGRCRYCAAPVSIQYPLVETAVASIMATVFFALPFHPAQISSSAWGIFWLVTAMLWFRGEVRQAAPFFWPLILYVPLRWLSGTVFDWWTPLMALGISWLSAQVVGRRARGAFVPGWFGVGLIGLLATARQGMVWPALLVLTAMAQTISGVPPEPGPDRKRLPLLIWTIAGLASCAATGSWGFN